MAIIIICDGVCLLFAMVCIILGDVFVYYLLLSLFIICYGLCLVTEVTDCG